MPTRKNWLPFAALSVGVGVSCGTANDVVPGPGTSAAGDGAMHVEMPIFEAGAAGGSSNMPSGSAGGPSAPADATAPTPMEGGGGPSCDGGAPAMPSAAGATIDVRPPGTLAAALMSAHPGDRIVLHARYLQERIDLGANLHRFRVHRNR